MVDLFRTIELTEIGPVNLIIQAIIFEAVAFLLVPLIGIVINTVIVGGVRKIGIRILGAKLEYAFCNYVFFVGVVIHELSHALFALVTGAQIIEVALFKPEGNSLGHVSFKPRGGTFARSLQNSFSACAPVVTGLLICALFFTKLFSIFTATWHWVIGLYILISVIFHMNMSTQDLKVYFKGALPVLCVFLPITLVVFVLL